ncbi:transcriptional regulatory protein AlgP-like isoform X4 [Lethenteron reissneri]|uniref:transcriptional regulatory protein AlgP-like isoform X4 n=1 Tax=Lethenteron reissneri TaxID=7753 RepID=UPI002AB70550|nr:transcriptional regulatory protein AlgP-like isoform X4 [Lethenteron reissneri]
MSLEIMQDKSTADETIPLQSTGELDSHVDTSGTAPATGARGAGGKMAEEPLGGEERKEADDKASCVVHEEESLKSPKAGANKATCSNSGKVRADALHERVPEEGKHLVKADTDGHGEKVSTKKEQLPVVGKNALNESQQKSEVDQKASRGGVQEGGMELVSDRERRNSKPLEKRSYTSTPEKDKQEKKRRKVSKKGDVAKRAEVRCRSPGRPANRSQRAMLQGSAKRRQKVQSKAGDGKSVEVSPRKETPSSPIKKPKSAAEARAAVSAKRAGEQKTRLGMTPALSSTKTASKPARPSAPASEKHPATTTTGSALRSSAPASARSTLAVKQDVAKLTGTLRAKPSIPVATEKSPRPAAATAAGPVAAAAVSVTAKALVPAAASPTRPTSLLTDRCAKPRMTQQKSPVSTGAGKKGSGTTPVTTPAAAGAVGRPPGSARTSMAPRAPGAPGAFPELSHVGQRRAQCRGHAGRGLALSANHPRREEGLSHPDDAQVARGHGAKPQPEGGAIQDRLHRQHQAPASRWQDPNRDQKTGLQPRDVKVRLHG